MMYSSNEDSGFTLVEMMTTVGILSVVLLSLVMVFNQMTKAMQTTGAQAKTLENVTLIAHQIAVDLQNVTRNHDAMTPNQPYHLVEIDGDNKYENSLTQSHNDFTSTSNPNDVSDRLHMHASYANSQLSNGMGSGMASEVTYYVFWVNGPSSPHTKFGLKNRFGIVRRRIKHDREALKDHDSYIPYHAGEKTPVLDLNESSSNHDGTSLIGTNIDYLSFQYYDGAANTWRNCWDTTGTVSDCDYPSTTADPRYPTAVRFAIRGYDERANDGGTDQTELVKPVWYEATVVLD